MLNVLGIKNVDKLVPTADDLKPKDPITENMGFMSLKPTKAFAYQDHESHLQTHLSFMQDPKLQQIAGQSPMFQQVTTAVQAHIAEHLGFVYRRQMEEMLGVPLPDPDEPLPEDVEYQMSSVIAKAAQKLLQKDTAEVQQQQNEQASQDPIIQQAMKELQIKEMEVQAKMQRDQAEIALKAEDMRLRDERERERIESQERIAGANIGSKAGNTMASNASKEQIAGAKIGIEAVKNRNQNART